MDHATWTLIFSDLITAIVTAASSTEYKWRVAIYFSSSNVSLRAVLSLVAAAVAADLVMRVSVVLCCRWLQHAVFGVCRLIDILVPDVPNSLQVKIKREQFLAKQALADTDQLLQVHRPVGAQRPDQAECHIPDLLYLDCPRNFLGQVQ